MKNVCFFFAACLVILILSCQKKNKAPEIQQINSSEVEVYVRDTVRLSCLAVDADKDSLGYKWTSTVGSFTETSTGSKISWKAPDAEGIYTIKVAVNDGKLSNEKRLTITVKTPAPTVKTNPEPVKESVIPKTSQKSVTSSKTITESVGKAPVADFDASMKEVKVGEEIQFTDKSSESPQEWSWDFGDGTKSTQQNPSKAYSSIGTYTISLKASNNFGNNTLTKNNFLKVNKVERIILTGTQPYYGYTYKTVKIGDQWWFAENLQTTMYSDGTNIQNITDMYIWDDLKTGAYCWYNNDPDKFQNLYGALYNGHAVHTGKLCPVGWHIPTEKDWGIIRNYLIDNGYNYDFSKSGKNENIGKSLAAQSYWKLSEGPGSVGNDLQSNNSSGFSGLPGGYRNHYNSKFEYEGVTGFWWSSTTYVLNSEKFPLFCSMGYSSTKLGNGFGYYTLETGFSVRCVKDN
jgi:uncharacterized protein (TIGR02145 family)